MNKMIKVIAAIMSLSMFTVPAFAGQAEIDWVEPDKFTDIRPGNESRSNMQKRVFKELEQHFSELAEKLPAEQTLKISVTNLDLAGDIRYMVGPNNSTIRVVEDLYFPKMKFDYQLVSSDKSIISTAKADIKDMSFNTGVRRSMSSEAFYYEKNMIDDWFYKTFPETKEK
ncbi:DUF3016 domain-containing protein [Thalassotalea psychrophila]|uniref:DUF3016 domain-containing protein n=1 Tax=Thalassotalea psychrophila TaxID=3065647 RepID=A0ABY9TSI8_9GAMM|nr:DUF3016 domain-containing protein [Colwelliaceae bacterium SQ149]